MPRRCEYRNSGMNEKWVHVTDSWKTFFSRWVNLVKARDLQSEKNRKKRKHLRASSSTKRKEKRQFTFLLLILSLLSNAWSSSKAEDLGSKSGGAIWPRGSKSTTKFDFEIYEGGKEGRRYEKRTENYIDWMILGEAKKTHSHFWKRYKCARAPFFITATISIPSSCLRVCEAQ